MLKIFGKSNAGFCDGISRRDFLRIGSLGLGGLALPQLLRAEQLSGIRKSHKAVIMIYMAGAPPHQDMYDLKMDAPMEIRGPHKPMRTNVPGIQISEHMPYCAKIMDKLVPIRTMYGSPSGDHDSFICYTGRPAPKQPPGGWPSMGATLSKLQGQTELAIPAFVGLAPKAGHPPYGSPGHPGFLGAAHSAFRPNGPGMEDMKLNGVTLDRLGDRKALLGKLRPVSPGPRLQRRRGGVGRLQPAGLQHPHLQQAHGGLRHLEGIPQDPRALRQGGPQKLRGRRAP